MYKTVRQGENSLQYTILPQSEEVFTNSGLKGKGRDYSPSNQPSRRTHRRLNAIHFTFLFFSSLLTVAVALVILKHFGVTSNFLPRSIAERIRAFKILNQTETLSDITTSSTSSLLSSTTTSPSSTTSTISSMVTNFKTTESESNLSILGQSTVKPKDETQAEFIKTTVPPRRESNNDLMLGHGQINWTDYQDEDDDDDDYDINKSITNPSDSKKSYMTKTSSQINVPTVASVFKNRYDTSPTSTTIKIIKSKETSKDREKNKTVKFSEAKENILDDNDEDFKEFNNDPVEEVPEPRRDDIKMSQTKSSWLQNKWPFVDPSSYFQWTVSIFIST